jgi:hypothetical protein
VSYNLKHIASLATTILANTKEGMADPDRYRRIRVLGGKGSVITVKGETGGFTGRMPDDAAPTVSFVDDGCGALAEAVQEILKDAAFREKVGQAAVLESVGKFAQNHFGHPAPDEMRQAIKDEILQPLRAEIRPWKVIVPVVNLVVKTPLSIGPVTLTSYEPTLAEATAYVVNHPFGGPPETHDQQRVAALNVVRQTTGESKAFAHVQTEAHPKHCCIRGRATAALAINLLRSFTHAFYSHSRRVRFGLSSELQTGISISRLLSLGQEDRTFFQAVCETKGALFPFELDGGKISHLRERYAFGEAVSIMEKNPDKWTPLEYVVVQAAQTLGRSVLAQSADESFLGCTIAVERLLIPDGTDTTVERFSDRLALLLGATEEDRVLISRSAKRLYDLRSKIVHAAFVGVTDDDYVRMENWAIRCLIEGLKARTTVPNHAEFCDKINTKKFA